MYDQAAARVLRAWPEAPPAEDTLMGGALDYQDARLTMRPIIWCPGCKP